MPYLILHVLVGVGILQTLRFAQWRRARISVIITIQYLLAACATALFALLSGTSFTSPLNPWLIVLGCTNGILYLVHLAVIMQCAAWVGVGIAAAAATMGAIVPVVSAWLLWGEPVSSLQLIGLGLFPVAAALVRSESSVEVRHTFKSDTLLFLNFILAGIIFTTHKKVSLIVAGDDLFLYQIILFPTAFLVGLAYVIHKRLWPTRLEMRASVPAGLFNAAALVFLLWGLQVVLAATAFPFINCAKVVIHSILDVVIWKQNCLLRQFVGIGIAIVVILLVTMG